MPLYPYGHLSKEKESCHSAFRINTQKNEELNHHHRRCLQQVQGPSLRECLYTCSFLLVGIECQCMLPFEGECLLPSFVVQLKFAGSSFQEWEHQRKGEIVQAAILAKSQYAEQHLARLNQTMLGSSRSLRYSSNFTVTLRPI